MITPNEQRTYRIELVKSNGQGEENRKDICRISIEVIAANIDEAMMKAWDILRVTPQDYEIVRAEVINFRGYRNGVSIRQENPW